MFKKRYLITLAVILLLVYMFIEPYWIENKEITIESDQIPAQFDGKKIVFLSDIHAGPFFNQERIDSLVKQVNALNPDLILLGGDYVDGNSEYIQPTFKSLSKLKAPLGVYAVLGNKDPQDNTLAAIPKNGITYIGNKGTWITENGSRIRLGGVGDYNNGAQIQNATTSAVTSQDFVILVSHNPDYFPKVNKAKVDLVLAGHTHGGQVNIPFIGTPILPVKNKSYSSGLVLSPRGEKIFISKGIGWAIFPVRFNCAPEIAVLELVPEST